MITIYGASDDLVEVDGPEGPEEYAPDKNDRWQADLVAPGATEQMRVHCWYDTDGCWQAGIGQVIEDVPLPPWPVTMTQHESGYSVLLSIDAPAGTRLDNIKPAQDD